MGFTSSSSSRSARATPLALAVALGGVGLLWSILVAHDNRFFWRNDFQLWYSPVFEETVRAWRSGEWPILSLSSWTTGNLGGEYQAGTFSLWHNAVLVGLWSLPLTLPGKAAALVLVHLCVLSVGVVLLSRQRGAPAHVAATTALIVTWSGWLITWGANQWFVALSGFVWVPWGWWAMQQALDSASRRLRWLAPAPLVYLTLSAGSPFACVMLGLVTAWIACRQWRATRQFFSVGPLVVAWLFGLGLSAPAWWMLRECLAYSVRADWGWSIQREWIVPWAAWLGLIDPGFTHPWQAFWSDVSPRPASVLLGGLVPLSALGALAWRRWRRRTSTPLHRSPFLTGDLLFVAALALLCSVPLFGSFRWSFRFLPLFHLALALAGGEALRRVRPGRSAIVAALLLAVAASLSGWLGGLGHPRFLAVEAAIVLAWWACSLLPHRWARWSSAAASLAVAGAGFTMLDLQRSSFAYNYHLDENILQAEPLDRSRLYLGICSGQDYLQGFHAPLGWGAILRPGNTPLAAGLHFLNGYSSFTALGVPEWFETFGNMIPSKAEALLSPEGEPVLAVLGVDGLVIGNDYLLMAERLGPEWEVAHVAPEGSVLHRTPTRARPAQLVPLTAPARGRRVEPATLRDVRESRQSCVATVESAEPQSVPSAVLFARPFLPGYIASLGGRALPVKCYAGMIPMVELPAGARGELRLAFRPASLRYGVPLALGLLAVWIVAFSALSPPKA